MSDMSTMGERRKQLFADLRALLPSMTRDELLLISHMVLPRLGAPEVDTSTKVEAAALGLLEALDLDCGSSVCMFARERKGMRNNGGCRCIESRKPGAASKVAAAVRTARAALREGEKL